MKKGFTLIELLVVIAIIGILSAIGLISLNGAREKARDAQAKSDLGQMRTALTLFADDNGGQYPGEWTEGTNDTSNNNQGAGASGVWINNGTIVPDYLSSILESPSANSYGYFTNSIVDGQTGGTTVSCNTQNCYMLYYVLESTNNGYYYALFEDGGVIDLDDAETGTPTCADSGDCSFT